MLEAEIKFTKVFKAYKDASPAIREARCLEALYPDLLPPIEKGDLFAGRSGLMEWKGVGFTPDVTLFSLPHGMGYFYREDVFQKALEQVDAGSPEAAEIREMMDFWRVENTTAHVKAAYTPEIRKYLPSDAFAGDVGVGFPLYRMTGAYENYEKLIKLGFKGLLDEVHEARNRGLEAEPGFFEGLEITIELFRKSCAHYARMADTMMQQAEGQWCADLERMRDDLTHLVDRAPETFTQAIQISWLYSCMAGVMDYGRMDMYLGDFLDRDLREGRITEDEAQRCMNSLWRLMVARKTVYHGRVVIGGRGRPNEAAADRVAMMAMEASRVVHDIEPQLTLRFYEGMNPELMRKAYAVIGEGVTYPMLYNDDVNIKCVENAFRVSRADAEQYVPFGCGEYIIDHKSFGSPNGVINLLKALEVTLFNGRELIYGREMGLVQKDFADYQSFDEFYEAYKRQLAHYIRVLADVEKVILVETGRHTPFLMMSLLYDGCVENGKSMFNGGLEMLGATLESYGNINALDSLVAIRELVFEKKLIAPERLLAALKADFAGYEAERKWMLDCPKFGNDDPQVDDLAYDLHDFEARCIRDQADRVGLHSFLMVIINNSANTSMGHWTAASADGRRSKTFMANAVNPTGGMDKKGLTAMLNSLVRIPPENHAGTVQNIKFTRELYSRGAGKVQALMDTYFENGGTQAMITVVGRQDLENALKNPDQYKSLIVRVGGFSARFVELSPDIQQELLSRTAY